MAWHTGRASRLPTDWAKRRERVAARAGGRCEAMLHDGGGRCEEPGSECDHIMRGDDHGLDNLQWLCHWHHAQKTRREALEALKAKNERNSRPAKHPGLI